MSRVKHRKIVPPTFGDVWGFDRLLAAFLRARRAKRGRGGEPLFYLHLEENLLQLSQQLRQRTFRPDPIRYFHLWNKKDRIDTLDHLVRDELGWGAYLRYMDDMLLFGHSKAQLWEIYSEINAFCQSVLRVCADFARVGMDLDVFFEPRMHTKGGGFVLISPGWEWI